MSAVKGKAQKQKSKSKSTKQEMGACNQKESTSSTPLQVMGGGGKVIAEPLINKEIVSDKSKTKSVLSSFKKKVSKAMKSMAPSLIDDSTSPNQATKLEGHADALDKQASSDVKPLSDVKIVKSAMIVLEARIRDMPKFSPQYLLGKDPKSGNLYTFPVGKLEEAESPLDAAKREFQEEIGSKLTDAITHLGVEEWIDPDTNVLHKTSIFHSYEPEDLTVRGELRDVRFYDIETIKLISEENRGRKCVDFIFADNIAKKLKSVAKRYEKPTYLPWGDDAIVKDEPGDNELVNESRSDRIHWFRRALSNDAKVNTTGNIMSQVWKYSNHSERQEVMNFIMSKGYTCTSNETYEKITNVTKNVMDIVNKSKDSLLEEMMLQSDRIVSKVDALQSIVGNTSQNETIEDKTVESNDAASIEDSEDVSDEGSIEDDKALFLAQCLKLVESEDAVIAGMWKVFIEYAATSEPSVQAKILEDGSANKPDLISKYTESPIQPSNEETAKESDNGKSFSEKKAVFESQSPELAIENEKRIKMNAIMKDFHLLHGENFEYNAHLDHLTVGDKKVHIRICPFDNQPFVFTAKNKPSNRCDIFEVLESKMYAQCEFQAKNTSDVPMLKALADRFTEYMTSYTDLQNCDGSASV